jgi:hypothetical protein
LGLGSLRRVGPRRQLRSFNWWASVCEHVRDGDKNVEGIVDSNRCSQVLEGAYFAGGAYRAFVRFCMA